MHVDLELMERIAAQRRFEPRTLEIAKRLCVYGDTPKRLSIEYGVNIQRVYAIRKEILMAARGLALPMGWVQVTIAGPASLIEEIKRHLEFNGGRSISEC